MRSPSNWARLIASNTASSWLRLPDRLVVSAGQQPHIPWKNGAGRTRDIAVLPAPQARADFAWRISVAEISGQAPFSLFPGIDRTFLPASTGAMRLTVDGIEQDVAFGRPLAFAGETTVFAESSATTLNVNLMTRRGLCSGSIDVRRANGPVMFGRSSTVAVVPLAGYGQTADGQRLGPLDFLLLGPGSERVVFERALVAAISVRPTSVTARSSSAVRELL